MAWTANRRRRVNPFGGVGQAGVALSKSGQGVGASAGSEMQRPPVTPPYSGPTVAPVDTSSPSISLSKKYNVLDSPYADQGDLDARANQIAQAQIQPTLDQLAAQQRQEDALHAGKQQSIISIGNWSADKLSKAQQAAISAGQALQNNAQAINTNTVAGLAGQAGADAASENALATRLQGTAPASDEAAKLTAAATAVAQGDQNNITNNIGAMNAAATESVAMAPIFVDQASREEAQRNLAALNEISSEKKDAAGQLGGLRATATSTLEDQEMKRAELQLSKQQNNQQLQIAKQQLGESKANRLFQQYMAEQEFGLKSQDQSFQQWLAGQNLSLNKSQFGESVRQFNQQNAIDWANVGINQQQVVNEQKRLAADIAQAKGQDKKEQAKAKADAYNNALVALNSYMAPGKNEVSPGAKPDPTKGQVPYQARHWDGALNAIMQTGVTKATALTLLSHSSDPAWRDRATQLLQHRGDPLSKKNRRNTTKIANSGIGWIDGGPVKPR